MNIYKGEGGLGGEWGVIRLLEYIRGTQDSRGGKSFKISLFSENLPFPRLDTPRCRSYCLCTTRRRFTGLNSWSAQPRCQESLWTKTKTDRKAKIETETKTKTTQVTKILRKQPPDQFLLDGGCSLYKEGGKSWSGTRRPENQVGLLL